MGPDNFIKVKILNSVYLNLVKLTRISHINYLSFQNSTLYKNIKIILHIFNLN
jgi:hypothetical protein